MSCLSQWVGREGERQTERRACSHGHCLRRATVSWLSGALPCRMRCTRCRSGRKWDGWMDTWMGKGGAGVRERGRKGERNEERDRHRERDGRKKGCKDGWVGGNEGGKVPQDRLPLLVGTRAPGQSTRSVRKVAAQQQQHAKMMSEPGGRASRRALTLGNPRLSGRGHDCFTVSLDPLGPADNSHRAVHRRLRPPETRVSTCVSRWAFARAHGRLTGLLTDPGRRSYSWLPSAGSASE